MHTDMGQRTQHEVLAKLRRPCLRTGTVYKCQLLDQAVALFGYHRKAAIRALRAGPPPPRAPGLVLDRPKTDHPETLLPIVKPIWLAAFQPCGLRLHALLLEWLPAYETDHRRLGADLRQTVIAASPRTWDRLLASWRVAGRRLTGTRPGSLRRQSIPIRGEWTEEGAGWMELDTVALCGGCLDDRHLWMLDGVAIGTDRAGLRALENRSQHATVTQMRDPEGSLPFPLRDVDSDNGGEEQQGQPGGLHGRSLAARAGEAIRFTARRAGRDARRRR
jgi:hypothetical protein